MKANSSIAPILQQTLKWIWLGDLDLAFEVLQGLVIEMESWKWIERLYIAGGTWNAVSQQRLDQTLQQEEFNFQRAQSTKALLSLVKEIAKSEGIPFGDVLGKA